MEQLDAPGSVDPRPRGDASGGGGDNNRCRQIAEEHTMALIGIQPNVSSGGIDPELIHAGPEPAGHRCDPEARRPLIEARP